MKQEEEEEKMEEAEDDVKNEPPREQHKSLEAMIEPPKEKEQSIEPPTFSIFDLLSTSSLAEVMTEEENEEVEGRSQAAALPLSATSSLAEVMTDEEKEEEEEVAVTTTKQEEEEEEEEVEAEEEEEVREEEWRGEKILQTDEEEDGEKVEVLQNETELPHKPLTFSATFHIVTSPMFKLGERVPLGGAEQAIVRFVGHPHFNKGMWIGVELERQRQKNDGPIDEQRYFTMFVPVRKVALLKKEEEAGEEEKKEREEAWRVEWDMLQRDEEEEEREEVDVLQNETELLPKLLTFSATCDILTSAMLKPGQCISSWKARDREVYKPHPPQGGGMDCGGASETEREK